MQKCRFLWISAFVFLLCFVPSLSFSAEGHGTSDLTRPGGPTIDFNSRYGMWGATFGPDRVFNDQPITTDPGWGGNPDPFAYVGYAFDEPVLVRKVNIGTPGSREKTFDIIGSNDQQNWDVLFAGEFTQSPSFSFEFRTFLLNNTKAYRFYAVRIHDTWPNGHEYGGYVFVREMELFEYHPPTLTVSNGFAVSETYDEPTQRVVFMRGTLQSPDNVNVQTAKVYFSGSEQAQEAISNVKFVKDTNGNGRFDDPDQVLASMDSLDATMDLSLNFELSKTSSDFLIVGDVNNRMLTEDAQASFAIQADSLNGVSRDSGVAFVNSSTGVQAGPEITLAFNPPALTVGIGSFNQQTMSAPQNDISLFHGTLTTSEDVIIENMRIYFLGDEVSRGALSNVRIVHDLNQNGRFDAIDQEIAQIADVLDTQDIAMSFRMENEVEHFLIVGDVDTKNIFENHDFQFSLQADSISGKSVETDIALQNLSNGVLEGPEMTLEYIEPSMTVSRPFQASNNIDAVTEKVVCFLGTFQSEQDIEVRGARVYFSGSDAAKESLSNVKLARDVNANGLYDEPDEDVLFIEEVQGTMDLSFSFDLAGTSMNFLIAADIDHRNIVQDESFSFAIQADSVEASQKSTGVSVRNDSVGVLTGASINLIYDPPTLTAGIGSFNEQSFEQQAQDITLFHGTFTSSEPVALESIQIYFSGSEEARNSLSNVRILRDINENGTFDDLDTPIHALEDLQNSQNVPLNINMEQNTTQILIVADIETAFLTEDQTFHMSIGADSIAGESLETGIRLLNLSTGVLDGPEMTLDYVPLTFSMSKTFQSNQVYDVPTQNIPFFITSMASSGDIEVTSLRMYFSGSEQAKHALSNVRFMRDVNGNQRVDEPDEVELEIPNLEASQDLSLSIQIDSTAMNFIIAADVDQSVLEKDEEVSFAIQADASSVVGRISRGLVLNETQGVLSGPLLTLSYNPPTVSMGFASFTERTFQDSQSNITLFHGALNSSEDVKIDNIRVSYAGLEGARERLSNLRILKDVNRNGVFDAQDQELATVESIETAQDVPLNMQVSAPSEQFIITADLDAEDLRETQSLALSVDASSFSGEGLETGIPINNLSVGTFQGPEIKLEFIAPTMLVRRAFQSSQSLSRPEEAVVCFQGSFESSSDIEVQSMRIYFSGNEEAKQALSNISLVRDTNANGVHDEPDEVVALVSDLTATMDLSFSFDVSQTSIDFLISADIDPSQITEDSSLSFAIQAESVEAFEKNSGVSVKNQSAGVLTGSEITLSFEPPTLTAGFGSFSEQSFDQTAQNATFFHGVLTASETVNVQGMTVFFSGDASLSSALSNVRLVQDINQNGLYELSDVDLASMVSVRSTQNLELNLAIQGETAHFLIVGDVNPTVLNQTHGFQFSLDAASLSGSSVETGMSIANLSKGFLEGPQIILEFDPGSLAIGQTLLSAQNIQDSKEDIVFFKGFVETSDTLEIQSVRVFFTGDDMAASSLSNLRLVKDVNGNGLFDGVDVVHAQLAELPAVQDIELSWSVDNSKEDFLIVGDFDHTVLDEPKQVSFGVPGEGFVAVNSLTGVAAVNGSSGVLTGSLVTLNPEPIRQYEIFLNVLADEILQESTENYGLLKFSVKNDELLTYTQFQFAFVRTDEDIFDAISNVKLWKKNGALDSQELGDELIASFDLEDTVTVNLEREIQGQETFLLTADIDMQSISNDINARMLVEIPGFQAFHNESLAQTSSPETLFGRLITLSPPEEVIEEIPIDFGIVTFGYNVIDDVLGVLAGESYVTNNFILDVSSTDETQEMFLNELTLSSISSISNWDTYISSIQLIEDDGDDVFNAADELVQTINVVSPNSRKFVLDHPLDMGINKFFIVVQMRNFSTDEANDALNHNISFNIDIASLRIQNKTVGSSPSLLGSSLASGALLSFNEESLNSSEPEESEQAGIEEAAAMGIAGLIAYEMLGEEAVGATVYKGQNHEKNAFDFDYYY